jgi:hypothetical protein
MYADPLDFVADDDGRRGTRSDLRASLQLCASRPPAGWRALLQRSP